MPRYSYDDKFIKCPFFVSETANAIKCEGVISYRQIYIFSSAYEMRKYKQRYCTTKYCECKNYREVSLKYEKRKA